MSPDLAVRPEGAKQLWRRIPPGELSIGPEAEDSSQFKTKSPRTRGEYKRIAEGLQAEHGAKRVAHVERRHVRIIRDAKTETPGAANNVLRMMKILLNFAVDDGLTKLSPAAKMKELPVGEWRAWADKECELFEKRWKPGTMQRRAYGTDVTSRLKENGIPHVAFNGANKPAGGWRVPDGIKLANARSEAWWRFREELNPDREGGSTIALPDDPELLADLAAPRFDVKTGGGILVESKEEIRKRLGRSPDKGDSVVMCLAPGNTAVKRQIIGGWVRPEVQGRTLPNRRGYDRRHT
jgi:hypothetical protein